MDAPSSAPASAAVSALLQQLKSGDISKMQLFQQLAKLQARGATQPPAAPTLRENQAFAAPLGASVLQQQQQQHATAQAQPPPAPPAPFITAYAATTDSRSYAPAPLPVANAVEGSAEFLATGVSHDKVPSFSVKEWMASKSRASTASAAAGGSHPPPPLPSAVHALFASRPDNPTSTLEPFAPLPQDESPAAGATASPYVYTPQRHYGGDAFAARGQAEPAFIDFSEHFRDDLDRALDGQRAGDGAAGTSGGGGGGGSAADEGKFHARVTRWKSQKEAVREQLKQQLLQSELRECTFAPKVNARSTRVVAKLRGRGQTPEASSSPLAVSERLYQEADGYKAREELAARVKAEEEAEAARECTFRPRINRPRASSVADKVKAKYLDPPPETSPSLAAAAMEAAAKELHECTFQPKVNPIAADMVSAQLYLQQDIYERLSRPCAAGGGRGDRRRSHTALEDDATESDSADSDDFGSPRPRRAMDDLYVRSERGGGRRRRSAASGRSRERPRSAGGAQTDEDKAERAKQFERFLERQKFHETARVKRLEQTKQQLAPGHKPRINKASQLMMGNGRKGDFLERISSYARRKEHDAVKGRAVRVADPHCTFKPSINQASAKRKARSVTELSRGDLLRRETSQRLMKLKMEQEEMAALTFRPQLNRVSEQHEGRLKILSSPDTYLQRIQQHSQAHTVKQRRALQEKELEEFAECTFKPRTIEAPAYVQRIARSVSLTKALRQQQQATAKVGDKPEWK